MKERERKIKLLLKRNKYFAEDFDIFISIIKNYFNENNITHFGENILDKYENIEKLVVEIQNNGMILFEELFIPFEIFPNDTIFVFPEIMRVNGIVEGNIIENNVIIKDRENNCEVILFNSVNILITYNNRVLKSLNEKILLMEYSLLGNISNSVKIALLNNKQKYILYNERNIEKTGGK